MLLKFLVDEDLSNYKETSMFIGFPTCSFKCNIDSGCDCCQNYTLMDVPCVEISIDDLCKRYVENPLTHAIVIGGLEPFDSPFDLTTFIFTLRNHYECKDTVVIYSGYSKEELMGVQEVHYPEINSERLSLTFKQIISFKNIIVKYGRYNPEGKPVQDEVIGVTLASDNQFAEHFI